MIGSMRFPVTASMVALLLLATFSAVPPDASADETVPPVGPVVDRLDVQDSVLMGLDWFAEQQAFDGSWSNSVGITGMAVLCFANAGYDHTNRTVQRALGYMRQFYNSETGSIADSFLNYETAISLMAMSAVGDPQDAEKLDKLTGYLRYLQFSEDSLYNMSEYWYRGGWPNHAGIPDVSNSQFTLLGLQVGDLYADGVVVPAEVWTNASTFMRYCQNWPDLNDLPWAHNGSLPSHGDGGFVYNGLRSRTSLGELMFESYGSITAGGYYGYLVTGNDPGSPEVAAARAWLDREYSLEVNPRMLAQGLYYYLWTQSRALAMSPNDWVVDGSGKLHDWRAEVADYFMGLQLSNGGWPGNPQVGWREEEQVLAGIYSLLSMETAYLMAPDPELEVAVVGGTSVRFIDTRGHTMATDLARGLTVGDRTLSCTDPETLRRVWVAIEGPEGTSASITATGGWGEGRTSTTTRAVQLGKGGASAMVAAGGFAGPMGLHIITHDRGPVLGLEGKAEVRLASGETEVMDIGLVETSGEGPVIGATLVSFVGDGVVADVDEQGVDVPAGGKASIGLTVSLAEDARVGEGWSMVVLSSSSPPVHIEVVSAGEPSGAGIPNVVYWTVLGVLVAASLVFFLLPALGRRGRSEG